MRGFCCQQEAAENLLAVLGVTTSGETAQIAAQMFEPAFAQVRRAQPMAPLRWEVEKRQHLFQLALEFLDHHRRGTSTAGTESQRPLSRLIAFHQPDLFPPAQPRYAHLLQVPPQRRPTFPHRVSPTVNFLPSFLGFLYPAVPFCLQQPFHGSLQHLSRLPLYLPPSLS